MGFDGNSMLMRLPWSTQPCLSFPVKNGSIPCQPVDNPLRRDDSEISYVVWAITAATARFFLKHIWFQSCGERWLNINLLEHINIDS